MQKLILCIIIFTFSITTKGQIKKLETPHLKVKYDTETERYVFASLKVLDLARDIAIRNGFILPDRIKFSVIHTDRNVIYIDRKRLDGITLEYKSLDAFLSPKAGGKNNIYGLCHELGHLCMHTITTNTNNWMSYNYMESWAVFFGNCVIDSVEQVLGTDFWPEPYNYLEFSGTDYMKKRIERNDSALIDMNKSYLFWMDLNSKIGFENINSFFKSIDEEKVRNPNAKDKYLNVLKMFINNINVEQWFNEYAEYLIIVEKD